MKPTVTICITNFQSGDAVALCIESIRKYTAYPHEIAVIDDASDPTLYGGDLSYLRACRDKRWIRFIENERRMNHGPSLGRLLNTVTTDLAMIMDCDIQILRGGWLEAIVSAQEKSNAAIVVDLESFPDNPAVFKSWFFMLDMRQYPALKTDWDYSTRPDFLSWEETPNALYPTGYLVYKNAVDQGRAVIPIPRESLSAYRHYAHIAVLSYPFNTPEYAVRQRRYAVIQAELKKLRAGA